MARETGQHLQYSGRKPDLEKPERGTTCCDLQDFRSVGTAGQLAILSKMFVYETKDNGKPSKLNACDPALHVQVVEASP